MSPKARYRLQPAAVADLTEIGRFTRLRWGRDQQRRYLRLLETRFELLAATPLVGAARDDIAPGLRGSPVGRHVIFYRIVAESVLIVRVLHDSMDVPSRIRDA